MVRYTMIDRFSGNHYFLSNMYPRSIEYRGMVFQCVESAFQAAKFEDPLIAQCFIAPLDGFKAKKLGGRRGGLTPRPDWLELRVDVMRELLTLKFPVQRWDSMTQFLVGTGDAELVEGNDWGDRFWGVCNGVGENWLGRLLMERRLVVRTALAMLP